MNAFYNFGSTILLVLTLFACSGTSTKKKERVLPFIGNFDIEYKLIDGVEVADTVFPTIPYFYFWNEDSIKVTSKDLQGKIWVTDFFFTTCSTICPRMTDQMKRLNGLLSDLESEVQFISFSINPTHDTPSQLKLYRKNHQIDAENWVFLTGDEAETHRLGIEDFRVFAGHDDLAEDGYAHSEAFTLVDKEGYVRGVYNVADSKQVDQLEKDIRKLLKYEYNYN
jgi:protein SCO1/2